MKNMNGISEYKL